MDSFEGINVKKRKIEFKYIIGIILVVISGIGLIFNMLLLDHTKNSIIGFIVFTSILIFGIFYIIVSSKKYNDFCNEFKDNYLSVTAKQFFEETFYKSDQGFSEKHVKDTKLLDSDNFFTSNDYLSGICNDTKFKSSEIQIGRKKKGDTDKSLVFIYRILEIELNKTISGTMVIGKFTYQLQKDGFEKAILYSKKYNHKIKIYTTNSSEIDEILSPEYVETIHSLYSEYNKKIAFSFMNNKLYIAIKIKKPAFKIKKLKPINEEVINNFKKEFKDISILINRFVKLLA